MEQTRVRIVHVHDRETDRILCGKTLTNYDILLDPPYDEEEITCPECHGKIPRLTAAQAEAALDSPRVWDKVRSVIDGEDL
jgi:hypothetical protein